MIRCIIIDDEPLARDILRKYINDYQNIELVTECENAVDAGVFLQHSTVDLMFLDINMPKLSGLGFLRTLKNPPLVVFTTAYPEFAVEGFEVNALDYLVKPFSFERFVTAVNKVSERLDPNPSKPLKVGNVENDFIFFKADKKVHRFNLSDIQYFEAVGDYVKVISPGSNLLVHETMSNILGQLPSARFVRIHRSFIINLSKIEYIEGNQLRISNVFLPIGQNYKPGLMDLVG